MLKAGDVAPSFAVKDHEGKDVKLEDLRGKRVVLWFYPKADTPGCTMEGCGFRDSSADYDKKGVVVLGMSYDTPEENAAFAKKFRFPYRLLSDPGGAVAKLYGAFDPGEPGYPRRNTYVIGPDGKIEQAIEKVQPKFHARQLLEKLK
ncbi:MAG TPA: peroxiredoxin [Planctomycetota bacterium]|nr:peroxiredoxin [Planctomycetota bacterium]